MVMAGRLEGRALVAAANRVSIFDVLHDYFGINHPRSGTSYKDRCPFGSVMHSDGGIEKNWRTYPSTNSSYCFDVCGYMGPVILIERKFDLSTTAASEMLAQRYGFAEQKPWTERWKDLVAEQEQTSELGDPAWCVEALHTVMRRHPNSMEKIGDPIVEGVVEEELERLGEVLSHEPDEDALRDWFDHAAARVREAMA